MILVASKLMAAGGSDQKFTKSIGSIYHDSNIPDVNCIIVCFIYAIRRMKTRERVREKNNNNEKKAEDQGKKDVFGSHRSPLRRRPGG
jgi:hypothetical protein